MSSCPSTRKAFTSRTKCTSILDSLVTHGTHHCDQPHPGTTSGGVKLGRKRLGILAKMSDDPKTSVPCQYVVSVCYRSPPRCDRFSTRRTFVHPPFRGRSCLGSALRRSK